MFGERLVRGPFELCLRDHQDLFRILRLHALRTDLPAYLQICQHAEDLPVHRKGRNGAHRALKGSLHAARPGGEISVGSCAV